MTAAGTAAPAALGWVKSYRVTEDRAVIMTCHNPAGGPDIEVRVLPIELDSMLRKARETGKPDRKRRPL